MSDNPISKILSSAGEVLDKAFNVQREEDFWGALENPDSGLSLRGYDPLGNVNPQLNEDSRAIDYQEIVKIAKNRSYAFQIVDVTPPKLGGGLTPGGSGVVGSDTFLCNIPPNILYDKVGYSGEGATTQAAGTPNSIRVNLDIFVTVPIPFAGTFLKIDRLPSAVNSVWTNSLDSFAKPQYNNLVVPIATPPGGSSSSENTYRDYVILQFDSTDAPLIIARPGDSFKLPFNAVYVTTLNTNRRFSVTIGYNGEIVSPKVTGNYNLESAGGQNVFEMGNLKPEPFCISNNDQQPNPAMISVAAGATNASTIFTKTLSNASAGTNPFAAQYPGVNGNMVGWLTEVSATFVASGPGSFIILGVYVVINDSGGNVIKQVACLNLQSYNTGASLRETANYWRPAKPARFELNYTAGESLAVRVVVNSGSTATANGMWCITGYTLGKQYRYTTTTPFNYNTPASLDTF